MSWKYTRKFVSRYFTNYYFFKINDFLIFITIYAYVSERQPAQKHPNI